MRDIWYSDNRDLAKWGVLVHLARQHSLRSIIHVPYWRPEPERPHFRFRDRAVPVAEDVWAFFRDIRHTERLGRDCGIPVKVLTARFDATNREEYSAMVRQQLGHNARPLLLFLDPDTGLEPGRAIVTHVTRSEVHDAWSGLHRGDWLVLYQHARRTPDWVASVSSQFSELCDGSAVEVARSERGGTDVVFLCVTKSAG